MHVAARACCTANQGSTWQFGRASVAVIGVAVVARLGAGDLAVSALHRRHAGLAGVRARKALLDGHAVGGAAVAGHAVSVVADLTRLDDAVAAAGRVDLAAFAAGPLARARRRHVRAGARDEAGTGRAAALACAARARRRERARPRVRVAAAALRGERDREGEEHDERTKRSGGVAHATTVSSEAAARNLAPAFHCVDRVTNRPGSPARSPIANLEAHQLREVVAHRLGRPAADTEEALIAPRAARDGEVLDVPPPPVELEARVGDLTSLVTSPAR